MRALSAAIKDKKFSPAYLLFGEDEYRKEDALRHLLDAAVDPGTRDFNLDQRRGSELDAETLASLLAMPPMMAERRAVVIRDVTALKKDARAALEQYLRSPAADVLLVLTAPADAKADKVLWSLTETVESTPLNGSEVPKWIRSRVERLGGTIAPAAVELLQDVVGGDLASLAIEIDKLVAYASGAEIGEDAVSAVVGVHREETLAHLLDAVLARDARQALALIPGVLQQPKMSGVFTVMTLTTQTLALAIAVARGGRSYSDFMAILKSGSSNVAGRSWGDAAGAWSRHAGKWSARDLDHALAVLLQADLALKSSRVSSEEQVLATAILAMCGSGSVSNAA